MESEDCGFTYIFAPILDNIYSKLNSKVLTVVCIILVCLFATDAIYSSKHPNTGIGITEEPDIIQNKIE